MTDRVPLKALAVGLFWINVVALGLGLFGILVAIPHAGPWKHPGDLAFFVWALPRGGSMGMVTGALAMLVGDGWRRTLLFAVISCVISAAAELTKHENGLAVRRLRVPRALGMEDRGRVPYGVPLSWFYMGFAAYVLATSLVPAFVSGRVWLRVLLGTWLLTAWDLVLDPATALAAIALSLVPAMAALRRPSPRTA